MHILAHHYRSEFLATPQLVRIDWARGANGFEPTLLVKGCTLLLKYIALGARLQFQLARVDGRLHRSQRSYGQLWRAMQKRPH